MAQLQACAMRAEISTDMINFCFTLYFRYTSDHMVNKTVQEVQNRKGLQK